MSKKPVLEIYENCYTKKGASTTVTLTLKCPRVGRFGRTRDNCAAATRREGMGKAL